MSEGNSKLTIRVDGGPDELLALLEWFGHDEALRGRVGPDPARVDAGQMSGGMYEVLVVTLGASGIGTALARSLTTWLTYRRSDVKLTLTCHDGTHIEIDATRVDSPQVLHELRALLDPPGTGQ
ncbi:effector-associated constant component EACC1 [Nocardia sp. CA-119907]|uniref:effector-associated constant component EACC1 n=1 Tax=Nocardia sp. CA-119907 TaxID=3239973 RepID=UPI003D96CEBC